MATPERRQFTYPFSHQRSDSGASSGYMTPDLDVRSNLKLVLQRTFLEPAPTATPLRFVGRRSHSRSPCFWIESPLLLSLPSPPSLHLGCPAQQLSLTIQSQTKKLRVDFPKELPSRPWYLSLAGRVLREAAAECWVSDDFTPIDKLEFMLAGDRYLHVVAGRANISNLPLTRMLGDPNSNPPAMWAQKIRVKVFRASV
ncbi:hypothetical protein ISF_00086 [Cordyceps fumosorosea ARSEF 2679]|uniref:Uncharacterized protein n=1 Tax=Cordyceps fumosorosea (strain ARSEF 2679) TaxID=1081104 RepID=A0A168DZE6_CORFA|nr:hypothetical protein ISF_00086 [Cordyceps fumosorosea ARSEF 2679]OAA73185.1 hypothetical protein ISF_00086 [Cordyceps fumosorosea ARSEF 2679]